MSRKGRIPKTLDRKLRDLDDHLYFLAESSAKLAAGDEGYLKPLAAELRVLVCKSSGTEGLLWRVAEELGTHDAVHVHLAGNLNRDHPLARQLEFLFVPVYRAGRGDPRLIPGYYSLKEIVKECEALVVLGTGYTHERLIRAVAEQMGSAHEDDGTEPHLIELSGTVIADSSPLHGILMSDADLVLEVGEKTLGAATQKVGFARKRRPPIAHLHLNAGSTPSPHGFDFESVPVSLPPEGTVMFLVSHPDSDWRTNLRGYNFGVLRHRSLAVATTKHPDGTMELQIAGLCDSVLCSRKSIPDTDQPAVMVGFTWGKGRMVIYLCGRPVDTIEYLPKQ